MEEQPDTYRPMAGSSLGDPWVAVSEGARQAGHTCIRVQKAPQKSHLFKLSSLPAVHVWSSGPCPPCVQMSVRLLWEPLSLELLAGVSRCRGASSLRAFRVLCLWCIEPHVLCTSVDVTEPCRHVTIHLLPECSLLLRRSPGCGIWSWVSRLTWKEGLKINSRNSLEKEGQ